MSIMTQRVRKQSEFLLFVMSLFAMFKMSLFQLKFPSFLKKNIHTLQIFKNVGYQAWPTFLSIYKVVCHHLLQDALCLYSFDLYKTHKKTREDLGMILIGFMMCYNIIFQSQFFRCSAKTSASFQRIIAGNTFEDCSFSKKVSLTFSQSSCIVFLPLISSFT